MKHSPRYIMIGLVILAAAFSIKGQRREKPELPATLGLEEGLTEIDTHDFTLKLVRVSQTVAAFEPKGAGGFDFTPADRLKERAADGFHHLGDINFRVRSSDSGEWKDYSTASARKPVKPLPVSEQAGELAKADLSPTLPADCPIQIVRTWALDEGQLALRFLIRNRSEIPVQIGALGLPMIFNNIISQRSLEEAHAICSFFDPYIGRDAGYLQVTRLSGLGPALVVVPEGRTPFEAYRPLSEPMQPRQTFEGTFEWMVHSTAYGEEEWASAEPWNPPTMTTIEPGETRSYGVKFLLSPGIRDIEETLAAHGRPVAVGVPGYILPMGLDGGLFLRYPCPVADVQVEPHNAIEIRELSPETNGWEALTLRGKTWGRARVTIIYEDSTEQSIHYYVIKPAEEAVDDMGRFLMNEQWFEDPDDPFGRGPGVISYDRQADAQVLQDSRVWIAGLGDEGGSGSFVAAAMKQFGRPDRKELYRFERFVNETLWGGIQYDHGERKYGVRKSLFYYAPEEMPEGYYDSRFNWETWTSWDKESAATVVRSYNYPHTAAVYWMMYRLARNHTGLVTTQTWDWYLERAYQTGLAMVRFAPRYAQHGQMQGTVFLKILEELRHEGWDEQAEVLEASMLKRAEVWKQRSYPFGSEMAWDSTGQEEVYAWCRYFGYDDKAAVSLNSILGYMPTVPHWGYNGNARRYWDFLYGGKLRRIERQLHHYGSGLNAIPVLSEYRDHPEDFYLLRVGYGGLMGALSNIDREGFASAAFHSFPSTLAWDPYTGDYGPNFFGHAVNTATYVVNHPEFGWLAFGGNLSREGETIKVTPLDAFRQRVYIAPYGLWMTLDAGRFAVVEIDLAGQTVRLGLDAASQYTPSALMRLEQPASMEGVGRIMLGDDYSRERGAAVIPLLESGMTWIRLQPGTGDRCPERPG
ncbi:MAG: DUF5695 domain-containing protein [Candidatus Aminicenantaceae bacterium]